MVEQEDPSWAVAGLATRPGLPVLVVTTPSAGVLGVLGEIDLMTIAEFEPALAEAQRAAGGDLTVDLSGVTFLGTCGIAALLRASDEGARRGRSVHLVHSRFTERALRQCGLADRFPVARAAPAPAAGAELHDLREALRTRPVVAEAAGILRERYAMTDGDAAVVLLRNASRRFNVRLLTLAHTVLVAAPPRPQGPWFPARIRRSAPELGFCQSGRQGNRSVVLPAVLDVAMSITAAGHGHLHLVVPGRPGLDLAVQRGFPSAFDDAFAHVDLPGPESAAVATGEPVVIADLEDPTTGHLAEQRGILLAAGLRAATSIPLLTGHGASAGVVTVLHVRRDRVPTAQEHDDLRAVAAQAGAWLDWYQRTVVLDALEDVHRQARRGGTRR